MTRGVHQGRPGRRASRSRRDERGLHPGAQTLPAAKATDAPCHQAPRRGSLAWLLVGAAPIGRIANVLTNVLDALRDVVERKPYVAAVIKLGFAIITLGLSRGVRWGNGPGG